MKQPFLLQKTPQEWHPLILKLGVYIYTIGFLPIGIFASLGVFAVPYFFLTAKPEAPISKAILFFVHVFGAHRALFIYSFLWFIIVLCFSTGSSLIEWNKQQAQQSHRADGNSANSGHHT